MAAPVGALLGLAPALVDALARAGAAFRPDPAVAAAKAARRLGHSAWSMAKHDGDLAEAKDRLTRIAARPGWRGRQAKSKLVGVEAEMASLQEIKAVLARVREAE